MKNYWKVKKPSSYQVAGIVLYSVAIQVAYYHAAPSFWLGTALVLCWIAGSLYSYKPPAK